MSLNGRLRILSACLVAVLAAVCVAPARAQSASASLAGKVRFEDGSPVADAVVQARNQSTGNARSTVSNARGHYRMEGLGPGEWVVVALVGDGGLSDSRTVTLQLQRTTKIDFTARFR